MSSGVEMTFFTVATSASEWSLLRALHSLALAATCSREETMAR